MAERPHVLYVDDAKEITDLMTVTLGSEGFDVTVAHDGQVAGRVLLSGDIEQIGNYAPEIAVVEAIDKMLEQRQHQQERHDTRVAELQRRRFFTVFGDGRLHHPLDAVAAQSAVVADAFDFQQVPIDLPANLLQVGVGSPVPCSPRSRWGCGRSPRSGNRVLP